LVSGPSYQHNPDPGHNYKEIKWDKRTYLDQTRDKYGAQQHKDLAVIPTAKAPSIPSKKLAQTAYTGTGFDQVGPAAYNPKVPVLHPRFPEHNFTTSKVKRQLFEQTNMAHNNMCWAQNPGPGVYDFEKAGQKQFNSTGQNKVFQSKVPNCKDKKEGTLAPGPGAYKTVVSIEK
jgi:hypothetical protein